MTTTKSPWIAGVDVALNEGLALALDEFAEVDQQHLRASLLAIVCGCVIDAEINPAIESEQPAK